ncbi:fungal-specific transcription factor [Aspergillus terreus]|uniref:Fungal-specific transcription factor n=1 Tax=Aspergillus terreus TaxID=33178 RepID=A0A5M3Z1X2_ASPTE|nr:hypothetical protein ATETN484_0007067900 [Aspergillus terreus]GFF16645.1 fungal-specific transcription factor [Aspergillus terreus]
MSPVPTKKGNARNDVAISARETTLSKPDPAQPVRSNETLIEIPIIIRPERQALARPASSLQKFPGQTAFQLRNRIGLWISSSDVDNAEGSRDGISNTINSFAGRESESVATVLQQRYASAIKACERLPSATLDQLLPIYFSRVNHILPLVDKDSMLHAQSDGTASVFLERAICLVAAKDPSATPHLRVTAEGSPMTPRQFCSDIYKGLVVAINEGLEPDRITRIRVLALLSLHCEGYEGAEAASMHLCHAIHQAQTAGLHLDRPDRVPGDSLSALFWCLWTLDKTHACIGGRPVLFADRDIGVEKPHVNPSSSRTAFDIWFAISDLLARVISFYRPGADHTVGWEADFPTFEEIIGDNIRDDLDYGTLGLLELFYHAVGILSCRYKLTDRPDGSKPSYIRQGLAAVRIHSIIATECPQTLPPLPIVPYALALSMGVSYQQFRSSKLITHFERAKASLEACCGLLEDLGVYWYSAEAMARLGRKALHQIEEAKPGPSRQGTGSRQPALSGQSPIIASTHPNNAVSDTPFVNRSDDQRPFSDVPSTVSSMETHPGLETIGPQPATGFQASGMDGFADIDMLFGEFLDLSLPTNFWDPVFGPPDQSGI